MDVSEDSLKHMSSFISTLRSKVVECNITQESLFAQRITPREIAICNFLTDVKDYVQRVTNFVRLL